MTNKNMDVSVSQGNKEINPRSYIRETVALVSQIESAFLVLAERLYKIHNERLFEGEYETFDDFLAEAKISKATASKLQTIYETFVLKYKLPAKQLAAVGWSSLYAAAPYADSKEKAIELVEDAKLLTRAHFEAILRGTGKKQELCEHLNVYKIEICNDCLLRRKIYEN